jgi:hypothetical protein
MEFSLVLEYKAQCGDCANIFFRFWFECHEKLGMQNGKRIDYKHVYTWCVKNCKVTITDMEIFRIPELTSVQFNIGRIYTKAMHVTITIIVIIPSSCLLFKTRFGEWIVSIFMGTYAFGPNN